MLGVISAVAGLASSFMGSQAQNKAAAAAAAEAKRIREASERRAQDAKHLLTREVETMRTMRSMAMAPHKQAAATAEIQRAKGTERMARQRGLGRTTRDVREALFGDQLTSYLGREQQKIERYAGLTQQIFQASSQAQQQVSAIQQAGDQQSGQMMMQAQQMKAQAGDPLGKALGALAQGLSLAQQGKAANARMDKQMSTQFKQNFLMQSAFGMKKPDIPALTAMAGDTEMWDAFNGIFGMN